MRFQRQAGDGVAQVRLLSDLDVDPVSEAIPLLSCLATQPASCKYLKLNNLNLYLLQAIRVMNLLPAFLYLHQNVNFYFSEVVSRPYLW
jgi:hypothetical protein